MSSQFHIFWSPRARMMFGKKKIKELRSWKVKIHSSHCERKIILFFWGLVSSHFHSNLMSSYICESQISMWTAPSDVNLNTRLFPKKGSKKHNTTWLQLDCSLLRNLEVFVVSTTKPGINKAWFIHSLRIHHKQKLALSEYILRGIWWKPGNAKESQETAWKSHPNFKVLAPSNGEDSGEMTEVPIFSLISFWYLKALCSSRQSRMGLDRCRN